MKSRVLLTSLALVALLALSAEAQPLPDPVAYYPFDFAGFDFSGNGNNGALLGGAAALDGAGRTGADGDGGLNLGSFNNGAYMNIPGAAAGAFDSLVANDAATISLWIFGGPEQPQNQWTFRAGGPTNDRVLGSHAPWGDGTVYFDAAGCCGANQRISAPAPSPDDFMGQWNHYAYVKDGPQTAVYINGNLLVDSGANAILPLPAISQFVFGGDFNGGASHGGRFDDVAVFDVALSPGQITDLAAGDPIPSGGLAIAGRNRVGSETLPITSIVFETTQQPTSVAGLTMEVYGGVNLSSAAAWTTFLSGVPTPAARGTVASINWDEVNDEAAAELDAPNSYPQVILDAGLTQDGAQVDPNFSNYSVRMTGQIQIPANEVRFKDGNDDYAYFAVDLDGDDQLESNEILINDNAWAPWNGADIADGAPASPIVVANFTGSLTGDDAWRKIEFRMAEGGGGDNAALFWDQNPGGFFDEFTLNTDFLGEAELVPASSFRTFQEELTNVDQSTAFGVTAVFDVLVEQIDWDRIRMPGEGARLELEGAEFQINVLDPENLTSGFTIDLIRDENIGEITGMPMFTFLNTDAADWDTSQFALTGQLTFGGAPQALNGDYNGNGTVEQADLDLVLLNWGQPGTPAGWVNDLPEGNIDQAELDGVLLNWGNMAALGSGGAAGVPEPATVLLALLCLPLLAMRARRWRHRAA